MTYATVTFMVEGDEKTVQEAIESIQGAVESYCPDLPYNVTEDTWDDETA